LLAARPERARVNTVDLDRQIIPMRTYQRLSPTNFVALAPLERRQERRWLGRFTE
jgi:hypothetical protein